MISAMSKLYGIRSALLKSPLPALCNIKQPSKFKPLTKPVPKLYHRDALAPALQTRQSTRRLPSVPPLKSPLLKALAPATTILPEKASTGFQLNEHDIARIKRAAENNQAVVLTYGGTISCTQVNGILQPTSKTYDVHKKHCSALISKVPVDSSQVTRGDMNSIIRTVKKTLLLGAKTIQIEFGTDSAGFLVNKLLSELAPTIQQTESKILVATSMSSALEPHHLAKRIYAAQKNQEPGTLALFVGTDAKDQIVYLEASQNISLHKSGTKLNPFVAHPTNTDCPIPKELMDLRTCGYELITSNPTKSADEIIAQLNTTESNKVILIGLGDYNFFAHPALLNSIKQVQKSGKSIYLSTSFFGSFEAPDDIPYAPRHQLERLGCTIITQQKARDILAKHIQSPTKRLAI